MKIFTRIHKSAILYFGCLTSQQHANISQRHICLDNCLCCLTETEAADTTQSQYTDIGPTSASSDPTTPGALQSSHWSTKLEVTGMACPGKRSMVKAGIKVRSAVLQADVLPLSGTYTDKTNTLHSPPCCVTDGRRFLYRQHKHTPQSSMLCH